MVCKTAWSVLQSMPPHGLGMNETQRTLKHMFLAEKGTTNGDLAKAAVACYAIFRCVQVLKRHKDEVDPKPLLRLFVQEGRQGAKL
jgi:hypothetical protein